MMNWKRRGRKQSWSVSWSLEGVSQNWLRKSPKRTCSGYSMSQLSSELDAFSIEDILLPPQAISLIIFISWFYPAFRIRDLNMYRVKIFVQKLSLVWFLVKKTSKICCTRYVLRRLVFYIFVTVKFGNILLSSVICYENTQRFVRCTQESQDKTGACRERMIMKYTQDE